jgi:hypothetical protein
MFGHRFIARPFMLKNLGKRDFWSGAPLTNMDNSFILLEGPKKLKASCNTEKSLDNALRFFSFIHKFRALIGPAILGTLFWYLISALLAEISISLKYCERETLVIVFKSVIAVTVVLISFLYKLAPKTEKANAVFPSHNLFLLGITWTLWLFRIVGIWWIIQTILVLTA